MRRTVVVHDDTSAHRHEFGGDVVGVGAWVVVVDVGVGDAIVGPPMLFRILSHLLFG